MNDFYSVLVISTLVISSLTAVIWHRTRSLAFPVGTFFLYYWSIYGGWAIVADGMGRNSGKHYHYLFDRLFTITLDADYLLSLQFYSVFILAVIATVLWRVKLRAPSSEPREADVVLLHARVLALSSAALLGSFVIMRDVLSLASLLGVSGYSISRQSSGGLFTLHQVLNRVSVVPAALGFAVYLSGAKATRVVGDGRKAFGAGYILLLVANFLLCLALGNKNELFFALVAASLFYLSNAPKPRLFRLALIGGVLFAFISWIDFTRGKSISEISDLLGVNELLTSAYNVALSSNEAFGAHFSLYGALHYDIPLTYGYSLLSLAASIVPRIFWPARPDTIYEHYAAHVGAVSGQGYSIHHATGWYLNFGVLGLLAGAVLLGWIWAALYNMQSERGLVLRTRAGRIFSHLAFFTFSANLPSLIRGGPEAYKGVFVDVFIIPALCIFVASRRGLRPTSGDSAGL